MDYKKRIEKVRQYISKKRLNGCLILSQPNIFYLTGIKGIEGILFVGKRTLIFSPPLYYQQIIDMGKNIEVEKYQNLKKFLKDYKKVGFLEDEVSFSTFKRWKKNYRCDFYPLKDFIKEMRAVKENEEIMLIKKSENIVKEIMRKTGSILKEGITEYEVSMEIKYMMGKKKVNEAFPTIVASGINSSYPHHIPQNKKIKKGEPVIIDMGVDFSGYKSDITETFFIGEIPDEWLKIIKKVKEVQEICCGEAKEGVEAEKIYKKAVEIFKKDKIEKYFIHGIGHGIGIEVHELPFLGKKSRDILKKGMVFTIEPGIYIPGEGGVRFEKMVYI